jgi:hypothetical protein
MCEIMDRSPPEKPARNKACDRDPAQKPTAFRQLRLRHPVPSGTQSGQIIKRRRECQQSEEPNIPPPIEDVGRKNEKQVAYDNVPPDQQKRRVKDSEERRESPGKEKHLKVRRQPSQPQAGHAVVAFSGRHLHPTPLQPRNVLAPCLPYCNAKYI